MGQCLGKACEEIAKDVLDQNNDGKIDGKDAKIILEKITKTCCNVS